MASDISSERNNEEDLVLTWSGRWTLSHRILAVNILTLVLVIVGGLNWGLVGLFDFDLVAAIFGAGSALARIVYVLVGLSAAWQVIPLISALGGSGETAAERGR